MKAIALVLAVISAPLIGSDSTDPISVESLKFKNTYLSQEARLIIETVELVNVNIDLQQAAEQLEFAQYLLKKGVINLAALEARQLHYFEAKTRATEVEIRISRIKSEIKLAKLQYKDSLSRVGDEKKETIVAVLKSYVSQWQIRIESTSLQYQLQQKRHKQQSKTMEWANRMRRKGYMAVERYERIRGNFEKSKYRLEAFKKYEIKLQEISSHFASILEKLEKEG